jgi:hypothetical protein
MNGNTQFIQVKPADLHFRAKCRSLGFVDVDKDVFFWLANTLPKASTTD